MKEGLAYKLESLALRRLRERFMPPVRFYPGTEKIAPSEKIAKNPRDNFNPHGGPIFDLTVFFIADTHYYPQERHNEDPSRHLPTTEVLNLARKIGGHIDWHNTVPPALHNKALAMWPSAVEELVEKFPDLRGTHTQVVHVGDVAQDAVAHPGFEEAILQTQTQMNLIASHLGTSRNEALSILTPGDHDVDIRPWENGEIHHKVEWVYQALGLTETPACYLQEIGRPGQKPDKALLILDTNLMERRWMDTIREQSSELFSVVKTARKVQEALIEQAKEYDELVIVGHKPSVVLSTYERLEGCIAGKTILISGHRHIPVDSEKEKYSVRPANFKARWHQVRILNIGSPTKGAGGLIAKGKPVGYIVKMESGKPTADVVEVSPN